MVSIKSTYTIVPSEPTPKGPLWCSDVDQVVARNHVPSIHVYRPEPAFQFLYIIERVKESLGKILVHFYPLAGRIGFTQSGRFEVDCNEMGVTLLEAESAKSIDDYGDFEANESIRELIPTVDHTSKSSMEEAPLLSMQVTRTSCGGLCVGIVLSHIIADGSTFIHFVKSWAKLARGDGLDPDDMPFLDRTILRFSDPDLAPHFDHPDCKPFPLILGSSDNKEEQEKETTVASLKITIEELEKLRQTTNNHITMFHHRPYSRYEVLAAHIWRSASKARQNDPHQPTPVRIVSDIRSKLDPPLPQNYVGNAVVRVVTPTCLAGDIISNPLSYSAQKMREATGLLTNDYIKSQILLLKNEQNIDGKQQFAGNRNMYIVSWMNMPAYEVDFGWVKPVHFGPVFIHEDGRVVMLPGQPGAGYFVIAIRLQIAHMDAFKKHFYEDP